MKKVFLGLLLSSQPHAVVQPTLQEAEKKVEALEKVNVPTKVVLGLGAVASIISTVMHCEKTKQAKQDAQQIEEELYPWLNDVFERSIPGFGEAEYHNLDWEFPYTKEQNPFLNKLKTEAVSDYPQLLKSGFFNRPMVLSVDSQCPLVDCDYWNNLNITDKEKIRGRALDFRMQTALKKHVENLPALQWADGVQFSRRCLACLEAYSSDDFTKADSQAIYNDVVRPQVVRIGASAFACAGFIAGLVAFHTHYKKAVKKVEELKEVEQQG